LAGIPLQTELRKVTTLPRFPSWIVKEREMRGKREKKERKGRKEKGKGKSK